MDCQYFVFCNTTQNKMYKISNYNKIWKIILSSSRWVSVSASVSGQEIEIPKWRKKIHENDVLFFYKKKGTKLRWFRISSDIRHKRPIRVMPVHKHLHPTLSPTNYAYHMNKYTKRTKSHQASSPPLNIYQKYFVIIKQTITSILENSKDEANN